MSSDSLRCVGRKNQADKHMQITLRLLYLFHGMVRHFFSLEAGPSGDMHYLLVPFRHRSGGRGD